MVDWRHSRPRSVGMATWWSARDRRERPHAGDSRPMRRIITPSASDQDDEACAGGDDIPRFAYCAIRSPGPTPSCSPPRSTTCRSPARSRMPSIGSPGRSPPTPCVNSRRRRRRRRRRLDRALCATWASSRTCGRSSRLSASKSSTASLHSRKPTTKPIDRHWVSDVLGSCDLSHRHFDDGNVLFGRSAPSGATWR
jgi:hypothetical protein